MYSKHFVSIVAVAALLSLPLVGIAQSPRPASAGGAAPAGPPAQSVPPSDTLPPLSYVCPMPADAEVLEDQPGTCPKCGMTLQPIRLDLRYACPVHQTFVQAKPGTHPYDLRELVPVTVSVFWTCGEQRFIEPGTCASGSARREQYQQRPHGDHNPKHGGQFFMAPDAWHHIEGTYPAAGLFRLYFYNDYSKPLVPTGFTATVSLLDAQDRETVRDIPLKPGRISNTMEAALPRESASLPVRLLAHVAFAANKQPNAFNFTFPATTTEPIATPPATTTARVNRSAASQPSRPAATSTAQPNRGGGTGAAGPVASASTPAITPPGLDSQTPPPMVIAAPGGAQDPLSQAPPGLIAALDESVLPKAVPALLAELAKCAAEVQQTVTTGNLGQVWLPAMATKTVALALESQIGSLPAQRQGTAASAVRRVVTSAWELDQYGDVGNRQKMLEAYDTLASAIDDLKVAYGSR